MFKKTVIFASLWISACTWCSPDCPYIGDFEPAIEQNGEVTVSVKKKVNEYTGGGNYSKLFTDALVAEIKEQGRLRLVSEAGKNTADYEVDLHAYASHTPQGIEYCKIISFATLGLVPCWDNNAYFINVDITDNRTGISEGFTYQQDTVNMTQIFGLLARGFNPEEYSEEGVRKAIASQVLERLNQFIFNGGLTRQESGDALIIRDMDNEQDISGIDTDAPDASTTVESIEITTIQTGE